MKERKISNPQSVKKMIIDLQIRWLPTAAARYNCLLYFNINFTLSNEPSLGAASISSKSVISS